MLRMLIVLVALCLTCGLALAEDAPSLARVVAVERGAGTVNVTVKLKVLGGAFFADSPVELHLVGGRKATATLKLPGRITMLMKGDEVQVVLAFTAAAPNLEAALASEPGMLASHADGERLLGGAAAPSAPAPAPQAKPSTALKCPFEPSELQGTLGYKYRAATRSETPFPGGSTVECTYDPIVDDHATPVLTVSITSIAPEDFATSMVTLDRFLGGQARGHRRRSR